MSELDSFRAAVENEFSELEYMQVSIKSDRSLSFARKILDYTRIGYEEAFGASYRAGEIITPALHMDEKDDLVSVKEWSMGMSSDRVPVCVSSSLDAGVLHLYRAVQPDCVQELLYDYLFLYNSIPECFPNDEVMPLNIADEEVRLLERSTVRSISEVNLDARIERLLEKRSS